MHRIQEDIEDIQRQRKTDIRAKCELFLIFEITSEAQNIPVPYVRFEVGVETNKHLGFEGHF